MKPSHGEKFPPWAIPFVQAPLDLVSPLGRKKTPIQPHRYTTIIQEICRRGTLEWWLTHTDPRSLSRPYWRSEALTELSEYLASEMLYDKVTQLELSFETLQGENGGDIPAFEFFDRLNHLVLPSSGFLWFPLLCEPLGLRNFVGGHFLLQKLLPFFSILKPLRCGNGDPHIRLNSVSPDT